MDNAFQRTQLLMGTNFCARLAQTRVALVGVGGVGSWCAEALVRTGLGHLMLVDPDLVHVTNLNRQLMATQATLGQKKVEVLAARLKTIHPRLDVTLKDEAYSAENASHFDFSPFDYVIDAIDSVPCKALLIGEVLAHPQVTLFSAMGAARKWDPLQIRATAFKKIMGDPLARALRHYWKQNGRAPTRAWTCVWSAENHPNQESDPTAPRTNGSLAPVTASFGMALAACVINHLNGVCEGRLG